MQSSLAYGLKDYEASWVRSCVHLQDGHQMLAVI